MREVVSAVLVFVAGMIVGWLLNILPNLLATLNERRAIRQIRRDKWK